MQTTLYAVETIDIEGNTTEADTKEHEIVVDIPDRFHPSVLDNQILVEYDEGTFRFADLLAFKGGFPVLALWDRDTYKEFDYLLPVVSDRIINKAI